MAEVSDVVIVGGGITGCAAAYELSRAGCRVTVLEQRNFAEMGSGRTLAGVRQSGRHPAELPLAMTAVERWSTLSDELGQDVEYRQRGNLRLAEDDSDIPVIADMVERQRKQGLEIHYLDGNESVRDVAPALSETIRAASYTPTDGHANPIATVQAYAGAARRFGAELHVQTTVTALRIESGRVSGVQTDIELFPADIVIVAAGVETPRILCQSGLELEISLAMVPVIQTVPIDPILEQVLGTAKAHFAARQETGGRMRFSSGGRPIALHENEVTWESMQPGVARAGETLTRAVTIIPALREVPVSTLWGGLIDMTPDGVPVIDHVDGIEGLLVAAGFCGHGFCLGPVSGEILRDLATGSPSRFDLYPFRWGRADIAKSTLSPELLG
jgi:sarcosine oxidase, subunit beta